MTVSRRSVLAAAAAATGSYALTGCVGARRDRQPSQGPLRLMVVGVSGRGGDNLAAVAKEHIAVLCDVDRERLAKAGESFPDARRVVDYREVLQDPSALEQLDGVVISTPDHSHFLPAMLAMAGGLDVYCEKPLAHTVVQARRLAQTAAARGAITQMGTQIHANENYHRVVEAIRGGAVGAVREVIVFVNGTDWSATEPPKQAPLPDTLAWDLWLGPVTPRPYAPDYHPAGWRRYWSFGGGTTADMACHYVDLAFWALQLDAPVSLQADGVEPHPVCAPAALRCVYDFPARGERPAVTLHWHAGKDRPKQALAERGLDGWTNGVLFVGDDGWLISDYTRHEIGPEARKAAWRAPAPYLPVVKSHHGEWLDGCRARRKPSCEFGYAAALTETVLLANVAFRAARGRRLQWDAASLRTDLQAANDLLDEAARSGFQV